jgi:hypothetical protein
MILKDIPFSDAHCRSSVRLRSLPSMKSWRDSAIRRTDMAKGSCHKALAPLVGATVKQAEKPQTCHQA